MSVSDAAVFTTRASRSRGSKLLMNMIQPEEELAKHDSRSTAKAIRVPSSSHMQVMGGTPTEDEYREPIRVPSSSRMLQAMENHTRDDEYRDMRTANSPFANPRRKSTKTKLPESSLRERIISYGPSTAEERIISYGPSTAEERITHHSLDSIHSLDRHSTETQSSSKTIPLDEAHDAKFSPLSTHAPSPQQQQPGIPLFFTKDVVIHIVCSFLILGLLMLTISGGLAPHGLIKSFKGRVAVWTQLATSNQVQEWREHLKLTLKVITERLEERVEGLKEEMREEMKRRKEEAEEIREEVFKMKEARQKETNIGNNKDKRTNSHLPLATPSQWASGVDEVATLASAVQALPWTAAVGRPDYALASGGGRVVGHSLAYKPAGSTSWIESLSSLLIPPRLHPLSLVILKPSFNQPGQCLPLASSNVHVEVALRTPIFPDQVTLSHVSKSIAYDISSAPKDFHVYGLPPPLSSAKPASWILLGEFTYDIDKPPAAQTFNLSEAAKKTLISTIKLHVLSNYGSASHTCIYRLQVHGTNPQ